MGPMAKADCTCDTNPLRGYKSVEANFLKHISNEHKRTFFRQTAWGLAERQFSRIFRDEYQISAE